MASSAPPNKLRTALVLASIALTIFVGYIVRVWMFGQ
jgi:hypothetical protein